jgi:hypothetical protein
MSSEAPNRVKRLQYTTEKLTQTIEKVKSGNLTLWNASVESAIPFTTLKRKIEGDCSGKIGAPTILSAEDEAELETFVLECAEIGYPLTTKHLMSVANKMAEARSGSIRSFGRRGKKNFSVHLKHFN